MESQESRLTIRLLIFSGRPDPEWTPDEDVAHKLEELVREVLSGEPLKTAPPPVLGYRGFLVQNPEKRAGLPDSFTVFRGVVSQYRDAKAQHLRDTAGIENFLLDEARRQDLGSFLDKVGVGG